MLWLLYTIVLNLIWIISTASNGIVADNWIRPGQTWTDEAGFRIEAHGVGILHVKGTYYWFGETKKIDLAYKHGINCYSTRDPYLVRWKFEGQMIYQSQIRDVPKSGPYIVERPKVIFNQKTSKYVMYFHLDDQNYEMNYVGVAVADKPTGPYTWIRGYQPDGFGSLDMTLYQDEDGTAYIIRSVKNQFVGISRLTEDYLNTEGILSFIPAPREAPAMFKWKGTYYLWTSHLSGWDPNAAELWMSPNRTLNGAAWISLGNPTNNSYTFNSQSSYVLPYKQRTGETLLIYMGDRWNFNGPGGLMNASYIWLPIEVNETSNGTNISMKWTDKWKLSP
jgi:hypothetical protein